MEKYGKTREEERSIYGAMRGRKVKVMLTESKDIFNFACAGLLYYDTTSSLVVAKVRPMTFVISVKNVT